MYGSDSLHGGLRNKLVNPTKRGHKSVLTSHNFMGVQARKLRYEDTEKNIQRLWLRSNIWWANVNVVWNVIRDRRSSYFDDKALKLLIESNPPWSRRDLVKMLNASQSHIKNKVSKLSVCVLRAFNEKNNAVRLSVEMNLFLQ